MKELEKICEQMTEAATPLFNSPTIVRYRALLSACYHYTRDSGPQLQRAADLAPYEELREFFSEMAREEEHHFQLALADLDTLGANVDRSTPPAIRAFADYWNGIGREHFFQFVGATYVLENLASRLRDRAAAALAGLGLGPDRSRFVRTHFEADEDHGRRVMELCTKYLPQESPDILAGAHVAARYWSDGLRAFIDNT